MSIASISFEFSNTSTPPIFKFAIFAIFPKPRSKLSFLGCPLLSASVPVFKIAGISA
jgi:hypothetical protein